MLELGHKQDDNQAHGPEPGRRQDNESVTGQRQEHEKDGRKVGTTDRATISSPHNLLLRDDLNSPSPCFASCPIPLRDDSHSAGSRERSKSSALSGQQKVCPSGGDPWLCSLEGDEKLCPSISSLRPHLSVSSAGTYKSLYI